MLLEVCRRASFLAKSEIMSPAGSIDYGYPWWLGNGHLVILIPALAAFAVAWLRRWRSWKRVLLGLVILWSGVSFLLTRSFVASEPSLPAGNFLRSGIGRVLDIGAGTGRSSIMVLRARPRATLVASDLFARSFESHFGDGGRPQDRLRANLEAAGVADRASIETADMLALPFESSSFDAVVSAYAMDHVGAGGARRALAEAFRVVKPGGDFLLILIHNDRWTKFAFGPLLSHGATRPAAWWIGSARDAGFKLEESGSLPATLYLLLRRPA
jgi:SAM-dependent methyltransferase